MFWWVIWPPKLFSNNPFFLVEIAGLSEIVSIFSFYLFHIYVLYILLMAVVYLCVIAVQHLLNDPHVEINTDKIPLPVPFSTVVYGVSIV